MNRHFKTTFGIGHGLSRHPIGLSSSHPPESIFHANNPIVDFRSLYRCTGKSTGYPRHKHGIACLIRSTHCVKRHLKGRSLVLFYSERNTSSLRFYMINTQFASLWQVECTMESTESIGLHFLLSHFLIVSILQDNGISHTFLGLQIILQLTICNPRIVYFLSWTIDRTVGKHTYLFFLSCIQPFSHFGKTSPMDRHRFIIPCISLSEHIPVSCILEQYYPLCIRLITDNLIKSVSVPFVNTYYGTRHRMSTPFIQRHQFLSVPRQSSSYQEQRGNIQLKTSSLLGISVRFCNHIVNASLWYD